jgi:molybdopterin-guanine dinucleotide biosynthesis protein A
VPESERSPFSAIVLAGGAGTRLGGVTKAALTFRGHTFLERTLTALGQAQQTVVVGEPIPTSRPVTFTREDPAGGGPAAALLAGWAALIDPPELIAVSAVDMPLLAAQSWAQLILALQADPTCDGVFVIDDTGKRQLAGMLRREVLASLHPPVDAHGLALHRLLAGLQLLDVGVPFPQAHDVDTWPDLEGLNISAPLSP